MAKPIKSPASVVVQGTTVTATLLATYAKRIGSIDTILSVWANAATLQAAQHGNMNWLRSLFDMPALRLKSNELSKQGKEVLSYIAAYCPRVVWDKETKQLGLTKLIEDSVMSKAFIAVGETQENSETGVYSLRGKFYKPHGDFTLTFEQFKNIEKAPKVKEETAPSMTAKAFIANAEKALACFKDERFVGTPDELLAASLRAKELFLALDAKFTAAAAKVADQAPHGIDVDAAMSAKSDAAGQKGASTRAGGKVAPLAEAV